MSNDTPAYDPLTTLNVSLPTSQKSWVEQMCVREGYTTLSEYMRELIRRDQREKADKHLDVLLAEGLASGPASPLTGEDWAMVRDELKRRIAARESPDTKAD